jgi:tRNA-uridine 2-sulfurtransferase
MTKEKVVIGLSGGVDSSVAAALLLEQGYDVIGVFMRNWNDSSVVINNECPWIDDSNDALLVANKLGIPFQVFDLSDIYKTRIVDYMHAEYERGRTPNPDILCNREIKFDVFLEAALKLGAKYVATGHYCRKETIEIDGRSVHRLLAGVDTNKDQSYFLCQVNQFQLSKALFPIGHLQKYEVRELAKKYDLITAEKKDSQGLCFIGKVKLPVFLQEQLKPKTGDIIEIDTNHPCFQYTNQEIETICSPYKLKPEYGKVIGQHQGVQFYTIGQRKGLGVGGTELPIFIIEKDAENNIIYVGKSDTHAGLYRKGLFIPKNFAHWIREDLTLSIGEMKEFLVRIRYRQELVKVNLIMKDSGLFIIFEGWMSSIAAGQFAAWYNGEELVGSGVID